MIGLTLGTWSAALSLAPVAWLLAACGRLPVATTLALTLGLCVAVPPARPASSVGTARKRVLLRGEVHETRAPTRAGRWVLLRVPEPTHAGHRRWLLWEVWVPTRVARPADLVAGARLDLLVRSRDGLRPGVAARLRADALWLRVRESGGGLGAWVERLRDRGCAQLEAQLDDADAGLARAMLLGSREGLAREDRARFRNTGQGHLLAVSGVHVGLLVALVLLLVRWLGLGSRARSLCALATVALYVPVVGAPPSALRAGLAVCLHQAGVLLDRRPGALAILSWVLLLILATTPPTLFSAALQLSVAAVLAILLLAPCLGAPWGRPEPLGDLVRRRARPLRTAMAISMAAHIGTAPWLAEHLGELCPFAPWIAMAAVPLTSLLVASGLLLLLLAALGPLSRLPAVAFEQVAEGLRALLDLAQLLGARALPVASPGLAGWALYLLGYALLLGRRLRSGLLAQVLFHVWLLGAGSQDSAAPPSPGPAYDAAPMLAAPHLDAARWLEIWPVAAGLCAFAVLSARPLGWLTPGGAAAAWVLGCAATWALGVEALAALLAPFVVATLLGRLSGGPRHAARTARQVLANGSGAGLGVLLAACGLPEAGAAALLGGLACLGADTCATEIGTRYGTRPFQLAGRRALAAGESGAVTQAGLLASLAGALLAPLAFGLSTGSMAMLLPAALCGFVGALLDSVLGATLQFRGRDPVSGRLSEATEGGSGARLVHVSGWRWLGNDAVNLVSALFSALLAVALLGLGRAGGA